MAEEETTAGQEDEIRGHCCPTLLPLPVGLPGRCLETHKETHTSLRFLEA